MRQSTVHDLALACVTTGTDPRDLACLQDVIAYGRSHPPPPEYSFLEDHTLGTLLVAVLHKRLTPSGVELAMTDPDLFWVLVNKCYESGISELGEHARFPGDPKRGRQ